MSTWEKKLSDSRQRLERRLGRIPRVAILGIGQELRGDDAAGIETARRLLAQWPESGVHRLDQQNREGESLGTGGVLVLEAGPAPENYTGTLRRFQPDLVLMVDAAQMEAVPGEIGWLDPQDAGGISASTHTFPLGILARYLTQSLACEVALLGIQPAGNAFGAGLSQPVREAVERVSAELITTFGQS